MKFIHAADLHIGGWREPKLSVLSIKALNTLCERVISTKCDFLIIAGDLFNTSLPTIDFIKQTIHALKKLKEKNIPVYIIPGSHDYSPTGKTMLDVLEQTDLVINVVKAKESNDGKIHLQFTKDEKTGALLTGMLGKKNQLEKEYYQSIAHETLEKQEGFKIFLFHTSLDELKPKELASMQSFPVSLLPKGFDYYAGGHVHIVEHKNLEGYKNVIYPGPLFPNSFSELEKLKHGSYFMYDNGNITKESIVLKHVETISLNCNAKTPEQIGNLLKEKIQKNITDVIVLIRLYGTLLSGTQSDIPIQEIISECYKKEAYIVLKNTSALSSEEFAEIDRSFNTETLEDDIINEHLGQSVMENVSIEDEKSMIHHLIKTLSLEKGEGETNQTYEERLLNDISFLEQSEKEAK